MNQQPYANLSQVNSQKMKYLYIYELLVDYIKASQTKEQQYKKQKKDIQNDQQIELLQFDMKSIHSYIEQCQSNNLKRITLQERLICIQELSKLPGFGFNVLIYGYGSKSDLLQEIAECVSKTQPHLLIFSIKGYRQTFSFKQMILCFKDLIKKHYPHIIQEENDNKYAFLDGFNTNELQIVIIIHSVDGKKLVNDNFQQFLKKASGLKAIKVIASFDSYRYSEVNFIDNVFYSNINTFQPYNNEISTMLVQQLGNNKQEEGLQFIYRSLNTNQKELTQLLAKIIIKKKYPDGPSFQQFFQKCVNNAILSNKQQLKENLQELIEHNVIQVKKDHYTMPYPQQSLEILSKQQGDK